MCMKKLALVSLLTTSVVALPAVASAWSLVSNNNTQYYSTVRLTSPGIFKGACATTIPGNSDKYTGPTAGHQSLSTSGSAVDLMCSSLMGKGTCTADVLASSDLNAIETCSASANVIGTASIDLPTGNVTATSVSNPENLSLAATGSTMSLVQN